MGRRTQLYSHHPLSKRISLRALDTGDLCSQQRPQEARRTACPHGLALGRAFPRQPEGAGSADALLSAGLSAASTGMGSGRDISSARAGPRAAAPSHTGVQASLT